MSRWFAEHGMNRRKIVRSHAFPRRTTPNSPGIIITDLESDSEVEEDRAGSERGFVVPDVVLKHLKEGTQDASRTLPSPSEGALVLYKPVLSFERTPDNDSQASRTTTTPDSETQLTFTPCPVQTPDPLADDVMEIDT
jgi:hypothetical protein